MASSIITALIILIALSMISPFLGAGFLIYLLFFNK